MAVNLKAKGRQSTTITRETEGQDVFLRALRDGSLVNVDWKQAAVMAGYGYMVNVGALSTGIVGGGNGTAVTIAEPELCLSIPNGTSIMPLRIGVHVQCGVIAAAEEAEILIAVDQDKAISATIVASSTYTTEVIYNMNTLVAPTSKCACYSAFTESHDVDPVLDLELARKVIEFAKETDTDGYAYAVAMMLDLVYEPVAPPIINGPAMLLIYYGGDTATIGGFADVQWLERSESDFTL